jgi:tetratricopeptide (TPR) repeat protein
LNPRGIVLSNEAFLGPNEIASLRVVPELVFVNCCYLASGDPSRLITETLYDRAKFASGVAEALIQGGVRCVVAAGWAVDDAAAHTFAITFYRTLLGDATFSDAVTAARGEARKCGGTTWAAYQCYGDPDWTYRRTTADGQQPPSADPARELAGIASESALVLALDTMATRSEFQGEADQAQADRLRFLETTCAPSWRAHGRVAEAFGNAWAKILGLDEAIEWYERAQAAADGTASLKAVEELANLRARRAWEKLSAVETPTAADVDAARGEIESAMELLHRLLALGATPERQSLLGSAYKRLALVESRAGSGREPEARAALEKMKAHFEQAGRKDFYGAMNVIAAQVALAGLTPSDLDPDAAAIDAVRQMMGDTPPDFWSVVGQTEMTMYGAMAAGLLAEAQSVLAKEFTDHHQKVRAPKRWASVYDNGTLVLSAYARRKGGPESAAANEIRNLLKTLAQDPSSVRQAVQPILRAAPAADRPRRVRRRKKSVKR